MIGGPAAVIFGLLGPVAGGFIGAFVAVIAYELYKQTLLGLYEGTPLTERGFDAPLHPDRIWIFQQPIEDECDTDDEIREEIKTTIVHEVAHFFGLDDEYLEDLGY